MDIIKRQRFFLKILMAFVFTFVSLSGFSIDLNKGTYESVDAMSVHSHVHAASHSGGMKSGGFKSSSFKASYTSSPSSSSGYKSGGFSSTPKSTGGSYNSGSFKNSNTGGSSKGYNSGSFKESTGGGSSGYGSGSFKESNKNSNQSQGKPKTDTKGYTGQGSYPVPVPVGGIRPFGFFGGYGIGSFVGIAIGIVVIGLVAFMIYRAIRNRKL